VPEIDKERLFQEILNYGRNIGNWAPSELEKLIKKGNPVLIPVEKYKAWLEEMPEKLRKEIIKSWGEPENSKIMTWKDPSGRKYLVIPAVRYGNIVLAPQPSRGLEQDVEKLYHDMHVPPHHQYVAFYLWLKKNLELMPFAI